MPTSGPLEQVTSCGDPAFRALYEIYASSIADREQKPEAAICKMVAAPEYRVLVIKDGERVTGFSILFLARAEGFALLEYMAVVADQREHGIGNALFTESMRWAVAEDGQTIPVLLEVDSDREACQDQSMRRRRQQFYRRLGCRRLAGLRYLLPLAGDSPPPEMDLLLYSAPARLSLPRADVERWLRTIYRDVYHGAADDPRIPRMLRELSDPIPLE